MLVDPQPDRQRIQAARVELTSATSRLAQHRLADPAAGLAKDPSTTRAVRRALLMRLALGAAFWHTLRLPVQLYPVRSHRCDLGVRSRLNALSSELLLGILPEVPAREPAVRLGTALHSLVEAHQQTRRDVIHPDFDLPLQLRDHPVHVALHQVVQLCRKFHTSRAASNDGELEQSLALLGRRVRVHRLFQPLAVISLVVDGAPSGTEKSSQQPFTNRSGVTDVLQEVCVLCNLPSEKESGRGACSLTPGMPKDAL